ncbi:hypothetical protein CC1G_10867 [Coprinopsis cinerea okayama7|uniref:Uncharacterized protein n=1 Tax=Coprinopsis cinerea (strain Okayama-7 / 130 / ATCC MYA-4618 / FGSC 9003) TaxID=240176 RepID=A8NKU8_COPC7|nr:hypothetical protein CC1G_10867 [Coprinopsis cinerea okayama7\|eukprot:XP_001834549.1 hypothetical protein CC1G_10867 [Coprinopsis cinerea okayama7\
MSTSPPILKIPTEVLACIIEGTLWHPKLRGRSDCKALADLQLVCRKWRDVIQLHMPRLWQGLCLNYTKRFPSVEILNEWFDRGGTSPLLQLVISAGSRFRTAADELPVGFPSFVASRRWKRLELDGLPGTVSCEVLGAALQEHQMGRGNLWASVREFAASIGHVDDRIDLTSMATVLPALECLRITAWTMSSRQAQNLTHPSLVSITLFRCKASSSAFASVFSENSLPCLQEVIIDSCNRIATTPFHPPEIRVNRSVERLVIVQGQSIYALGKITFPNLKFLRLEDTETPIPGNSHERQHCLYAFARRSCRNVHTLTLEDADQRVEDDAFLIAMSPSLRCLAVRNGDPFSLIDPAENPLATLSEIFMRDSPLSQGQNYLPDLNHAPPSSPLVNHVVKYFSRRWQTSSDDHRPSTVTITSRKPAISRLVLDRAARQMYAEVNRQDLLKAGVEVVDDHDHWNNPFGSWSATLARRVNGSGY